MQFWWRHLGILPRCPTPRWLGRQTYRCRARHSRWIGIKRRLAPRMTTAKVQLAGMTRFAAHGVGIRRLAAAHDRRGLPLDDRGHLQRVRSSRRGVRRRMYRHIPPLPPSFRDPVQRRDAGIERWQRGDPHPPAARVQCTPAGDEVPVSEQILFQDDPVIASLFGIDPALPLLRDHWHPKTCHHCS